MKRYRSWAAIAGLAVGLALPGAIPSPPGSAPAPSERLLTRGGSLLRSAPLGGEAGSSSAASGRPLAWTCVTPWMACSLPLPAEAGRAR